MAQFITCTNNNYSVAQLLLNLIGGIDTIVGNGYLGIKIYPVTPAVPLTPINCSSGETVECLLKRCIELDCCNRPSLRVSIVAPIECPYDVPCTTSTESPEQAMDTALKSMFVETGTGNELALVLIDMDAYCNGGGGRQ